MEHDAVPSHADRVARDKSNIPRQSIDAKASLISNDSGVVDGVQRKSRLIERKTPRVERPFNGNDSDDKRNGKIHALAQRVDGAVGSANLDGIVDLEDSVDTDKQTRWAPAVVHETVKPHVHEIREEKIYREIHHYDVNHYVQPVFETVLLPARHFMSNPHDEGLIEVSEDQLPGCTGKNQRWTINKKEDSMPQSADKPAKLTAPKVISDKTNMMPEGFERRETTIIHPPELEDMSHYKGPVMDIYFDEAGVGTELPRPSQDSVYLPNNLIPPRMASVRRKPLAPTQQ
ncbi:hypothetical protein EJ04DRAFT_563326 [Polyplosphaeria fusca]|uniref:Uncharacterized protein n=1 Tax=Polyplosphaeria fusca TaxID=682080 RepID=A0A9P4R275_9PLEO|nr:hypothetical protein EJ04DRAFT_563326 [Polyplosphaeria fusca]